MAREQPAAGLFSAEGGCACGSVRYRVTERPFDACYCHCRLCQLSSGAPAIAFGTVHRNDYQVTEGEPRKRQSSTFGERWFCADCGTPLAMLIEHQPDTIDISLATLDQPEVTAPEFHIWISSKIAWFETGDGLSEHLRFRPGAPGFGPKVETAAQSSPNESGHNPLAPPITLGAAS